MLELTAKIIELFIQKQKMNREAANTESGDFSKFVKPRNYNMFTQFRHNHKFNEKSKFITNSYPFRYTLLLRA